MLFILLIQFVFLGSPALSADLPSYIKLCKKTVPDISQCMVNSIAELIPYLIKGIPELNFPPIDPMHGRNVSFTVRQSSIKVYAELGNGVVTGLKDMKVEYAKLDFDSGIFETKVTVPRLIIKGQYRFKGTVMLFDIDGGGDGEINATDASAVLTQFGEYYMKDGVRYIKFDKADLKAHAEGLSIRLDDLFKNNEALTQSVNKLINDNIQTLKFELDELLGKAIQQTALRDFLEIYNMFPIDVLFPN
uniref:Uncharacterized protein n=1 Tax=Photinus pyralis TaxID=7054 RepID=A0A1Y1KJ36_PHOPY